MRPHAPPIIASGIGPICTSAYAPYPLERLFASASMGIFLADRLGYKLGRIMSCRVLTYVSDGVIMGLHGTKTKPGPVQTGRIGIMSDMPTREQLRGEAATYKEEYDAAEMERVAAIAAMERARGDKSVTMEALVELADGVRAAKAIIDRKASQVAAVSRRLANFDVIARADERMALMTTVHDLVKTHFNDAVVKTMAACGAERVTIVVDLMVDGPPTISVKPTGAKLTASAGKSGGGNGRGFKSAGPTTVDGKEYRSLNAAYVALRSAADGEADVSPANSKSAEAWLIKHGHTIT